MNIKIVRTGVAALALGGWYPGNNGVSVACNGQYCTTNSSNNGR